MDGMNRPIDKPEALARTAAVLNQRWITLLNSPRPCEDVLDAVAGERAWCGEAIKLYGGIAVVEFLRALVRVHDAPCDGWCWGERWREAE